MKKTDTRAPLKFKWSKKKTAVTAASLVLALTMVIGLLPNGMFLRTAAEGAGIITSVSGANSIPDEYQAVNFPKETVDDYEFTDNGENGIVAFDFHIFANEFASTAHTCGNVAVDDFGGTVLGQSGAPEIGSREEHDTTSAKLSYVNYPENWTLVHNDLVLGSGNSFKGNEGAIDPNGGNGQVQLVNKDGKQFLFGNDNAGFFDNKYIDDTSPMINIQDELDDAERYQGYLFDLMDDVKTNGDPKYEGAGPARRSRGIVKDGVRVLSNDELFDGPAFGPGGFGMGFGPGGKKIDLKKYPEKTIIIDFHPGEQWSFFGTQQYHEAINFLSGSVELKGTLGKRVIINIDTAGWNKNMDFFDTHMKADNLTNEEDSVHKDNNILWNFYDSSKGQSFNKKIEVGGTWVGTILAPDADVKCRAGLNGSIIANRVATTAETHKSDYTGEKSIKDKTSITVTKKWVNDNKDSRPEFITVKLLQNGKVLKTVELDTSNESSDDSSVWTYTFENLDVKDPTGKTYKYKVDEVVPAGYKSQVTNYTIINTGEGGTPSENGDLYVKKTDADGSNILAGARFRLTSNEGNNLSKVTGTNVENLTAGDSEVTWTSTGSAAKLTNLPYGNYTITEIGAPAGYKRSNEAVKVQVPGTDSNNPAVYKDSPISVKFLKRESINYAPLAGASFELTPNWGQNLNGVEVNGVKNTDSSKITFTSGTSEITFNKIPAGSYTITETVAPDGYDIAAPVTFIVGEDGSVTKGDYTSWPNGTVTMDDDEHVEKAPEYGALYIRKYSRNHAFLAGAKFKLANINGADISGDENHVPTVNDNRVELDMTHAAEGYITFTTSSTYLHISNLLAGTYTLTEIEAPAGFKPAAPVGFTITADNVVDNPYEVYIDDQPIELNISKKDMTSGEPVEGAQLTLYQADGTTIQEQWTTNRYTAHFSEIPAGTYILRETVVPAGYNKADDITITIDAYGNVSGNNVSGNIESGYNVTMYDKPASITIKKIIENSSPVKNLAGAKLQLKSTDTPANDLSNVTGVLEPKHPSTDTITWNSAGFPQELRLLPDGNYTLHEVEAPEGFDKADDITFTVYEGKITKIGDETVDVTELSMADKRVSYHDIDFSKITFQYVEENGVETPEIVKDSDKKNVVDETPIAGAKFGIFDKRSKSYSETEAVHILTTTDTNDQATIRLCDGDYVLVELEAPEGYVKTDEKIAFSIVNGQMTNVSLSSDEKATASYGNPKDKGLSLDGDCYYTLDATGIFERRGAYPSGVEFFLDPEYECTKITLYKDDYNNKSELQTVNIETKPNNSNEEGNNGKDKYNIDLGNLGDYDANYTYYAVLEIKKNGQAADGSEVGNVPLNFVYKTEAGKAEHLTTSANGSVVLTGSSKPYESTTLPKVTLKFKPEAAPAEGWVVGNDPRIDALDIYADLPDGNACTRWRYLGHWTNSRHISISELDQDEDGYYVLVLDPDKANELNTKYGISLDKNTDTNRADHMEIFYMNSFEIFHVTDATWMVGEGDPDEVYERTILSTDDIKDNLIPGDENHNPTFRLPNGKKFVVDDKAVELTKVDAEHTTTVLPGAEFILIDSDRNVVDNIYKKETQKTENVLDDQGNQRYDTNGQPMTEIKTEIVYKRFKTAADATAEGFTGPVNVRNVDADTGEVTYTSLVTDDYGHITVEGLAEGTYTFTEIEAPANYEIGDNTDTAFVLNTTHTSDSPKELTVANKPKKGVLDIIKYDEDRNPKAGAVFDLYSIPLTGGDPRYEGTYTTDHTGKVTANNLELNRLYYAVETTSAPGTQIPDALIDNACKVYKTDEQGNYVLDADGKKIFDHYTDTVYSKQLPRLNQTEVYNEQTGKTDEYRDSFYNIPNGDYTTAVTPTYDSDKKRYYLDDEYAEKGLHYGIILAESSDKLFVINTDSSDATDGREYINVDPDITGTIAVFDESTTTTIKKTDGTDILAGAKLKLESGTPATAIPKLNGVRSSTASDLQHVFYAVKDGVNYQLIPDDKATDGSWKRADGKSLDGCTFVEYLTWTSTDGTTVTVDPDTNEETVVPAPADFSGDVFNGLINGTYYVTELEAPVGYYDSTESVEVKVPAEADYVFTNYAKEIPFSLTAKKILEGRELTAEEFSFTLTGDRIDDANAVVDGTTKHITATNYADGSVYFDEFATYTVKDLGKTFTYTIKEDQPETESDTMSYDAREYKVQVTVNLVDGEPAAQITLFQYTLGNDTTTCNKIVFNNYFTEESDAAAPAVNKTLNGRDAEADEFAFNIYSDADCTEFVATASNTALTDGSKTAITGFDPEIKFDHTGTFTYYIKEAVPAEENKLPGVAYDDAVYKWTVTVAKDSENHKFVVTDETIQKKDGDNYVNAESADFVNTYETEATQAQVTVEKVLTGRDFKDGETYTIELTETTADENVTERIDPNPAAVTIGANHGTGTFTVPYTKAGTHTYTIKEQVPADLDADNRKAGVEYDTNVYTWTVVVKDNYDTGALYVESSTVKLGDDEVTGTITFTNEYSINEDASAQASFNFYKVLSGRDSRANDNFLFRVTDEDGNVIVDNIPAGDLQNGVAKEFTVGPITYGKDDVGPHTYTVSEINSVGDVLDSSSSAEGLTYSDSKTVTVNVTDNGDGTISANVENSSQELRTLTNLYTVSGSTKAEVEGTKTYNRDIENNEFQIGLYDSEGTYLNSFNVDTDGSFKVTAANLSGDTTYTFTIKEIPGTDAGIIYDNTEYTWTVEVGDNGIGGFKVNSSTITLNGESADLAFTNESRTASISKKAVGAGTDELPGAQLTVTALTDGVTLGSVDSAIGLDSRTDTTLTWTSGEDANTLYGLPAGIYELKEIQVPNDGYLQAETMYFRVDEDGTIYNVVKNGSTYTDDGEADGKTVVMFDDYNRTATISKKAVGALTDELPGATLTVTALGNGKEGSTEDLTNVESVINATKGTNDAGQNTITWKSEGNRSNTLSQLPVGFYELKEESAPEGFLKAEAMYFYVYQDGTVKMAKETEEGEVLYEVLEGDVDVIVMFDDYNRTATISKQAVGGGDELPGAILTVTALSNDVTLGDVTSRIIPDDRTDKTITWTSMEKRENVLSKLPEGYYELKEEKAPNGYLEAELMYFKVEQNGTIKSVTKDESGKLTDGGKVDKVVMLDDYIRTATISKQAVGGGKELPGAKLTVTALGDNASTHTADLSGVKSVIKETKSKNSKGQNTISWTSGDKENTLSELPAGYYELKEETAPNGYVVAEVMYFKVEQNGTVIQTKKNDKGEFVDGGKVDKVVMLDDYNRTANISKQAVGGGSELPGAKLTVTALSGQKLTKVKSKIDEVPNSRTDTTITWISGKEANTLSQLPEGVYSLTEITAPDGYEKAETIYFYVDTKGTVYSVTKKADGSYEKGDVVTDKTVTMFDKPVDRTVPVVPEATISKQAVGGGSELVGAKLTVKLESADNKGDTLSDITDLLGTAKHSDDKMSVTWTSESTANKLTKLPAGYYSLTEITAPYGYEKAETIYFKVEADGTVKTATKNADGTFTAGEAVTNKTITMLDAPVVPEATISKRETGSGSELPGAQLTVKLEKPDKTGDTLAGITSTLDVTKSDDNMSVSWTSGDKENKLSQLPAGIYSLTEITAPEGYEKAEVIYFKVEADGTVKSVPASQYKEDGTTDWQPVNDKTVIMYDSPKPKSEGETSKYSFEFTKKDCFDKNLAGASFQLKGTGYDKTVKSDNNGKVKFTDIPKGSYVLTETEAPSGYLRSTASFTVNVSETGEFSYRVGQSAASLDKIEKDFTNKIIPEKGPGSTDLKVGDTVSLNNELLKKHPEYANYNITWRSSDDSIVSVDQYGNTKVLGAGEATITAYYGDTPLMSFVLGASEEPEQSVVIGDNTIPNTRDLIIKWLKIASIALVISTMIVLGCIYLFKRRKNAKAAQ